MHLLLRNGRKQCWLYQRYGLNPQVIVFQGRRHCVIEERDLSNMRLGYCLRASRVRYTSTKRVSTTFWSSAPKLTDFRYKRVLYWGDVPIFGILYPSIHPFGVGIYQGDRWIFFPVVSSKSCELKHDNPLSFVMKYTLCYIYRWSI